MFTRLSCAMTNATFVCTHHNGQDVWLAIIVHDTKDDSWYVLATCVTKAAKTNALPSNKAIFYYIALRPGGINQ